MSRLAPVPIVLWFFFSACSQAPPLIEPTDPDLMNRGEELYNTNYLSCHGGESGGDMMTIPPRHNANGHTWHHSDCQLTDIVLNGSGAMGDMMREMMAYPEDTPNMPAWKGKLSEEEVRAILEHIKSWWTREQRELQKQVTDSRC